MLIALTASTMLAYGFVRSQLGVVQLTRNQQTGDYALQAAQTGAAVALGRMQTPEWEGVGSTLVHAFPSAGGSCRYEAEYLAVDDPTLPPLIPALRVLIRVRGIWENPPEPSAVREVEVVAELSPRLPGRTLAPGDVASVTDVPESPSDFDRGREMVVTPPRGSSEVGVGAGTRIDMRLQSFKGPEFLAGFAGSSTIRNEILSDIGARFTHTPTGFLGLPTGPTTFQYPHPLPRRVSLGRLPPPGYLSDLNRTKTAWDAPLNTIELPSADPAGWQTYRLYEGGPVFTAVALNGSLRDVTLEPTPDNPLGIFWSSGSVTLRNRVTVIGTLIAGAQIRCEGTDIIIAPPRFRTETGEPLTGGTELWPRLPAIVARDLNVASEARLRVEGAVVLSGTLKVDSPEIRPRDGHELTLNTTASVSSIEAPLSVLAFGPGDVLRDLRTNDRYVVRLPAVAAEDVFPVVGVDADQGRLYIAGEIDSDGPTQVRIETLRRSLVQFRGPVFATRIEADPVSTWNLTSGQWSERYSAWQADNQARKSQNLPERRFTEFLEQPGSFAGWPAPWPQTGMSFEPSVDFQLRDGAAHRWSPPLFRPSPGTSQRPDLAGYRWRVVSWKELK